MNHHDTDFQLIPYTCGAAASHPGCQHGPLYVFDRTNPSVWAQNPHDLYQSLNVEATHENLPPSGDPLRNRMIAYHLAVLRDNVAHCLQQGRRAIVIGGDHSSAFGSLAGLVQAKKAHEKIGVIWIDAHADINTPETSPSKAPHGMPLAQALGMGDDVFLSLSGYKKLIRPDHMLYLGLRDVDPGEWEMIGKLGITHYTMQDLRDQGIAEIFSQQVEKLRTQVDEVFISVDLDALDPACVPSVGTAVPGGFTQQELLPLLQHLMESTHPAVIEISEFNPTMPQAEITFQTLEMILKCFTGCASPEVSPRSCAVSKA